MTLDLSFSNVAGAAPIAHPCATARAYHPGFALKAQPQRSAILGVIHRNELRATIDPRVFNSRFSASEHRNALTMSPQGCTRDRASRPRHREVPSGDRKGKAAKRRVNALIGLLSFGYFSFQQKKRTSLQLRSSE